MEIRTSRTIAWFFAVIGVGGTSMIFSELPAEGRYYVAPFFALGGMVGIGLLIRPKRLLRIQDGHLELHTGALLHRRPKALIPLNEIQDFEVHLNHEGEGSAWFLTLKLKQQQSLPKGAKSWICSSTRSTSLSDDDPLQIHWMLTWPEGGGKHVQKVLDQYLRPTISP